MCAIYMFETYTDTHTHTHAEGSFGEALLFLNEMIVLLNLFLGISFYVSV